MLAFVPLRMAAAIAGIVIVALMIAGEIAVTVDDAWLWSLLALFSVCLLARGRRHGRRFWEQRWWWELDADEPGPGRDREPRAATQD